MARGDDGQMTWRSQGSPASPEALRTLMPNWQRGAWNPDADSRWSPEAGDALPVTPLQRDDLRPTRLDMSAAPAVSLAELLPDLYAAASSPLSPLGVEWPARTLPDTVDDDGPALTVALSSRPDVDESWPPTSLPPMRMALAEPATVMAASVDVDVDARPTPAASVPQGLLDTIERLALVAAGVLMGAVLTIVWNMPADGPAVQTRASAVAAGPETPRVGVRLPGRDGADLLPGAGPGPAVDAGMAQNAQIATAVPASARPEASRDPGPARQAARPEIPRRVQPQAVVAAAAGEAAHRPPLASPPADATAAAPPVRREPAVGTNDRPVPTEIGAAARLRPADRRRRAPVTAVSVRSAPPAALDVVQRYAAAYSRMDARATRALWPAADARMLAATFNGLREQRLTLSGCRGQVVDVGATVSCRGTLRYRPRLGDHSTRTRQGTWRFALAPDGDTWRIDLITEP